MQYNVGDGGRETGTDMHILALETTETVASIAVLDDQRPLLARRLEPGRRSAQTLIPGIQQLLAEVGWRPAEIQLIGLTIGPGSFTGLRVGATAAKTLAYATGAEVLGVSTLEVIARQAPQDGAALWAVMDAQREQVFAARFTRGGERIALARPTTIEDVEAWLAMIQPGEVVSGPVLGRLAGRLPRGAVAAPADHWAPQAEHVGQFAWEQYAAGERQDMWQLQPQYYRQSAAEEKLGR